MSETFADAVEKLRDLVADQVDGYRRLLRATREGTRSVRAQDVEGFEAVLAEQVEILRELKGLEHRRERVLREVGHPSDDGLRELETDLRHLAEEVSRAGRVSRLVIERNGALVEARLALHRRAGRDLTASSPGINQFA